MCIWIGTSTSDKTVVSVHSCCILICRCMQQDIQHNNDEQTQFFRKIYLSVYWKGLVWEGVGDWTELQHIDPQTLLATRAFLSRSPWLLNRGPGDQPLLGHGSHSSIFSPTKLNFLSPGLYNNLTSTYFLRASQFALNSTPRQSRSPLISSTGCTCYLHRCISSFDSLAGAEINMQHSVKPQPTEPKKKKYGIMCIWIGTST